MVKLHGEGREKQYALDFYEFKKYHDSKTINILAQIINSLVKGLSENPRLPTMIFVFMDDLIFTSGEIYLLSEIEKQLRWVFSTMEEQLKTRKKSLPMRSIRPREPKIFLIKSLPRYDFGRMTFPYAEFVYRQERYNTMLHQIGGCFGYKVIDTLSIDEKDRLCFDESGNGRQLSTRGMYRFWRELCQIISEIDKEKDRDNRKRILEEELNRNRRPQYHHDYHY